MKTNPLIVLACDVLEHVPDHIKRIKEVYRILKKGGHCIFTVPQRDHLKITYEDLSITNPSDREKAFGQFDPRRIYGDDFTLFLENCGFKVTLINANSLKRSCRKKCIISANFKKRKCDKFQKSFYWS